MINCSFHTVHERDIDLLFPEALVCDAGLPKLISSKTGFCNRKHQMLRAAWSETEADLGETEICVVLQIEDVQVVLRKGCLLQTL